MEVNGDWPNDGAELEDGAASGTNSRGDSVDVKIDDPSYNSEPNDE
jgi:hypothetical protein